MGFPERPLLWQDQYLVEVEVLQKSFKKSQKPQGLDL